MIYKEWSLVPENLKTITALRKLKLKPAQDQEPTAHKTGGYAPPNGYPLYDIAQAIPIRPCNPAQLAALEKARKNIGTFVCDNGSDCPMLATTPSKTVMPLFRSFSKCDQPIIPAKITIIVNYLRARVWYNIYK